MNVKNILWIRMKRIVFLHVQKNVLIQIKSFFVLCLFLFGWLIEQAGLSIGKEVRRVESITKNRSESMNKINKMDPHRISKRGKYLQKRKEWDWNKHRSKVAEIILESLNFEF
jgi:hypothetical protein